MTLRQANKGLYWAWKAMKQRCQNPKCAAYYNYGQRGIAVCSEWQEFEPFLEWALANGYQQGLDLDRKDNDGDYTPDNCRWITRRENTNNRRITAYITVGNETLPESFWADRIGVKHGTISNWRIKHGHDYAANRITEVVVNGYTPKDFGYSHRRAVKHMETGLTFDSVREAAMYFDIAPCTISNAMRENRGTRRGRFMFCDKEVQ